ncbi:MAG: S1 family peptidase [Methanosarcinales archaeon]|nr:S1 family peptidase [Methanosarcinales archaeon]
MVAGSIGPAAAIGDIRLSSYTNMTAEEVQRIVDMTQGSYVGKLDLIYENYDVLGVYGVTPEKLKDIENRGDIAYEHWLQVAKISRALADDEAMQSMHYVNGGLIIGVGTFCICYISIIVLDERADEFTEKDMLAIKERVDYYAALEGIEDIPLIFFRENLADSFLTEEQLLYLWESGHEGLIIHGGLENLTNLRNSNNVSVFMSVNSSENYAFGSNQTRFLTSFIDRILSFFRSNNSADMSYSSNVSFMSRIFGSGGSNNLTHEANLTGLASKKVRPIVGGLMIATSTSGGTVGYAARDVNDSNSRGIVTVGHVFHFENQTAYQPRQAGNTAIGTFSKMSQSGDSVFIPMNSSDVRAAVFTGDGDNRLLDVIGFEGAVSIGVPVNKSGISSGATEGLYSGVRYNKTFTIGGTINYTVNSVGVIQESSQEKYSIPGDSGGPIFIITRATVNGTEQDVAVLLGVLEGGDGKGTVYFVPTTEIRDLLGVIPLTLDDL